MKYLSTNSSKFETVVSLWAIYLHERDQTIWDPNEKYGGKLLRLADEHIPIYNESYSVWAAYTIQYSDVTRLNKDGHACSNNEGLLNDR